MMFTRKNIQTSVVDQALITVQKPRSPSSEAFRTLRTNLGFAGIEHPFRSILITSPQAQDGKSTIAANLAIVMAQAGHKVLLADCDLRKPNLHNLFNLPPSQQGLTNCLAQSLDAAKAAVRCSDDDLFVLTSGPIPPNPAEILNSARVRAMWPQLLEKFDYIIIDSPPFLAVTDAAILSAQADAVILVIRSGFTRRDTAIQTIEQLNRADAHLLGIVLNQVKNHDSLYYYR